MSLKQIGLLSAILVATVSTASVVQTTFLIPAVMHDVQIEIQRATLDFVREPEFRQVIRQLDALNTRLDRVLDRGARLEPIPTPVAD